MTGNTLPRLQTEDVKKMLIPIPSSDVQNKIADEVKNRMSQAEKMRSEAAQIIETAKQEVEKIILGSK
jgi:restriction endonuclease S subunit